MLAVGALILSTPTTLGGLGGSTAEAATAATMRDLVGKHIYGKKSRKCYRFGSRGRIFLEGKRSPNLTWGPGREPSHVCVYNRHVETVCGPITAFLKSKC